MAGVLERSAEQLHELSVHLADVNRSQAADELARLERLYLDVARKLRKVSAPSRPQCDDFGAKSRFAFCRNKIGALACGLASLAARVIHRKANVSARSGYGSLGSLVLFDQAAETAAAIFALPVVLAVC